MKARRYDTLGLVVIGLLILAFILVRSWHVLRWSWR